jgi:uncharacterized damage-inducible protein DinB
VRDFAPVRLESEETPKDHAPDAPPSDIPVEALMTAPSGSPGIIPPAALLSHWQGHRRVTRRVIAAFPADEFESLTIGGMRPFSALASELLGMAVPTAHGVLTGEWTPYSGASVTTQADVLAAWDRDTVQLNEIVPQIPLERYAETMTAFGQWTMPAYDLLLYIIDNEIHHRGQGYVYLRALGIEPPGFWDRS